MRGRAFEQRGFLLGAAVMRYAVVIEKAEGNYSAYVPHLPGCVATGDTVKVVEAEIREAIRFHIEGLKEDGLPIPNPTRSCSRRG
jgi:predicted RNase H-like HicB family nuclease